MKKIFLLFTLSIATIITSCTLEEDPIELNSTNLNALGTITFSYGEVIQILDRDGSMDTDSMIQQAVITESTGTQFTFSGTNTITLSNGAVSTQGTYSITDNNIILSILGDTQIFSNVGIDSSILSFNTPYEVDSANGNSVITTISYFVYIK